MAPTCSAIALAALLSAAVQVLNIIADLADTRNARGTTRTSPVVWMIVVAFCAAVVGIGLWSVIGVRGYSNHVMMHPGTTAPAGFALLWLALALYFAAVFLVVRLNPAAAPAADAGSLSDLLPALKGSFPVVTLFAVVIGGLYDGVYPFQTLTGIVRNRWYIAALSNQITREPIPRGSRPMPISARERKVGIPARRTTSTSGAARSC